MPAERLSMRRIRELLRLHFGAAASDRAIARELGVARSTVQDYLARAAAAGLGWPLPDELTDEALEERLFASAGAKPGLRRHAEPDWAALVCAMKRPGVSLTVLWEEYRDVHPGGYGYSRFCELYRDFEHRLSPTMRQHHVAGDKAFVDYLGKTIPIVDPATGEVRQAEIFVAVLGASNYTYAEASWTERLPDWIGAHLRMFRFGATNAHLPGRPDVIDHLTLPGRPHIFRRMTSCSISLSSARSATTFFSRWFSSSSCFSRFISDGISPPYFLRQL